MGCVSKEIWEIVRQSYVRFKPGIEFKCIFYFGSVVVLNVNSRSEVSSYGRQLNHYLRPMDVVLAIHFENF